MQGTGKFASQYTPECVNFRFVSEAQVYIILVSVEGGQPDETPRTKVQLLPQTEC